VSKRFVSALVFGCALFTTASAMAQTAVKVGFIAPTKSLVGAQVLQGAQTAVDMVNAAGGILGGRKIELIEYDTAFQPNEGVAAAQRLVNQDGVKVIAGEISSTVALAVLQVVRTTGTLFVAAVPKHPDITKSGYDRVFRLNSTTAMDAEFNDVLKNEVKPQKVAVIAENSDFGRLTIDNMKSLFGPQVVLAETYEMNQSDFSTLVTKTKASGADLICIAGSNMEQYGGILRMQHELKVPGRRCLMPGILNSKGVEAAGIGAEGVFSADIYVPSLTGELNRKFVETFQSRFKHPPEKIEALGFESVWLVAQAMTKAGTADDAGKISDAIRSNTWNTPRGDVKFDANGQASSGNLVRLVVKDGIIVPERK
jgi:branched-chain amino acid transport system substrate-binding protein